MMHKRVWWEAATRHHEITAKQKNVIPLYSFQLFDVRCQDWSNDVTLAFGASACQIILYRETSPINVVDLRQLSNQEVLMALHL